MSAERSGSFISRKPEYLSPYFSLEIRNPERLRRMLGQIYRENSFATATIGPDTGGIPTPPSITFRHEGSGGGNELSIGLRLPSNDYYIDFISSEGTPLWGSRKRGWDFERKLQKYVDSEFSLIYGHEIIKLRRNRIVRRVATLPDDKTGVFRYKFPERIFPLDESAASQTFFDYHLQEAFTIFIIYCTELFKYRRISDQTRKIIVDPAAMEYSGRKRSPRLQDLSAEEKQRIIFDAMFGKHQIRENEFSTQENDPLDPLGYFKILGIDPKIARELDPEKLGQLVERTYRTYANIFHPDVGGDHEQMRRLNEARDFLNNQANRMTYGRS